MLLTENQIKIADVLLKHIESVGGTSSIDNYPHSLRKNNIEFFDAKPVIQILIQNIGIIDYLDKSDRFLILTPEGNIAAKKGIKKYINDINEEKELQIELAKSNIEANKINAKNAEQNRKNRRLNIIFFIINAILAAINAIAAIIQLLPTEESIRL